MTIARWIAVAGLALLFAASPAFTQPSSVKLKGVALGMTLEEAAKILEADGYAVQIKTVAFEVAPNDPLDIALTAQKNRVGDSRDTITIRTSEHPTQNRIATINRRVIYEQRNGPIYATYDNALQNLVGGRVAHENATQNPISAKTNYEIGYEWNAAGGFVTPNLLSRLAQTQRPLCVEANLRSRNILVNLNQGQKASTPYQLNNYGQYAATRPGTYTEACQISLFGTATVLDETQIVTEFQQTLIDHATLTADQPVLQRWLREKQAETQDQIARERIPDL